MFGRKIQLLLLGLCWTVFVQAQPLSPDAEISLLTCTPGTYLYTLYGHTALRVNDPAQEIDVTFNYGLFDFETELFYWKFVRGETWYELGDAPMWWFMQQYIYEKRLVYEQVLNLTAAQREAIWQALLINNRPENSKYLYNFVFDNCATRPYYLIANTLGDTIISDYKGYCGDTYRRFLRHYTGPHSWANAGINLLFGPKADQPMNNLQRLFLPEELMLYLEQAHLSDGTPLVSRSHIAPFKIASTPWYASWEFGLVLYFLLVLAISYWDRKRHRRSKWLDIIFVVLYSLLLLLVAFLTFFSCHPLVGFGWRLLILPLVHLCARFVYILR
ncbi:MAG: DUF4105 domain-containing protein [Paludibacteraceae bacterium]|nr:DUF4105 domain-containing protein [Paludibacteraceae bacterium]